MKFSPGNSSLLATRWLASTSGAPWGLIRCGALVLALLGLMPMLRAQTAGRTVAGDRIVLGGSITPVAADARSAKEHQAVLSRAKLSPEELSTKVGFEVSLQMRDLATLQTRQADGEVVARAELEADHLPLSEDFKQVESWLISQGFTITRRDGHRLSLFAQGTVEQVQQAFQTQFAQVNFHGKAYLAAITAPSVPARLPAVLGVIGLQPFPRYRMFHAPLKAVVEKPDIDNQPPYYVSEILGAYNGNNTGLTGAGQEIGIIIDALPLAADLEEFWGEQNIAQSISNITSEATPNASGQAADARSGEETLDVSWSSGIAPAATVHVFVTENLYDANIDAAYSQVASDLQDGSRPNLHQLSMSYGAPEDETSPDEITTDSQYFATIVSYGVTLFASSGDNGAFDDNGDLSVSYPASDPSVTGVGGTSVVLDLSTGALASETAWTTDGDYAAGMEIGASGGGVSILPRPSWQTGATVPAGSYRLVPDVSSSADEDEGAFLVFTDPSTGEQDIYEIGGTSWSSPSWAGYSALLNQARANNGQAAPGLLTPLLYPLLGTSAFRDITQGNNSHYNENDGYNATAGYDLVTGIGSPLLPGLIAALGGVTPPTITSFSPASGTAGTIVTINGANLTPVQSVVFGGNVTASGTFTSTVLTVTVPTGAQTGPIVVTTAGGSVSTATAFTVNAAAVAPVITSAGTASGQVGQAFDYQIVATNSPTSYGATGLPAGLSVNTAGLISGTPSATGSFAVALSATNAAGTGTAALTLTILPAAPVITSASTATGQVGVAFSYQITATSAPGSFGASGLPAGLSVNPAGLISGTPAAPGSFTVLLSATNATGTGTAGLTLTVLPAAPVITSAGSATGQVGRTFSYQITATNSPTFLSASGLPVGLSVNTSGLISGTPSVPGVFAISLSAANTGGTGTAGLTLTILPAAPVISAASSAGGQVGVPFSFQITASNAPTTFAASGLPAGLSVNAAGLISGTPAVPGTFTVTLAATNAGGTGTAVLPLTILPAAPVITSPGSATGQVGVTFAYQITAANAPTSFAAVGLPVGLELNTVTGLISGVPHQAGTFHLPFDVRNSGGTAAGTLVLTLAAKVPVATLRAPTSSVRVGSGERGKFTVTLSVIQETPVTVHYKIRGSAENGTDYAHLDGILKIPAGKKKEPIYIRPLGDLDGAAEKNVKLSLEVEDGYTVDSEAPVEVKILQPE